MSRHNRRRSRGGRKHHSARSVSDASDNFDSHAAILPAFQSAPELCMGSVIPDVISRVPATPQRMPLPRSGTISARLWQNRHAARQNMDRMQREERSRLDTRKTWVFGSTGCNRDGDEGGGTDSMQEEDTDGLEEKMLEYFGGLKWLDT